MDISPNHSAEINTVGNFIANSAGFLSPIMVSSLQATYDGTLGWRLSFFISFAICLLAVLVWAKFEVCQIIPALNTKPT